MLRELEIRVVMVTFETVAAANSYRAETGIEWPILIDADREVYRAYGMQQAKLRHLLGPTTWLAYAREAMLGKLPRRPTDDTTQQGGDILVDPAGIVRFHHVGAGSGYRRPIDEILAHRRSS